MWNNDGLTSSILSQGKNKTVDFDWWYFSFAFGDEIALVIEWLYDYYILNCWSELWDNVCKMVKEWKTKEQLINRWIKQSQEYSISSWSWEFDDLNKFLSKKSKKCKSQEK